MLDRKDFTFVFVSQYGYVEKIPNIEVQTCPGEPAGADKG